MIARIQPRKLRGEIEIIPSKSEAHRLLICAALADRPTLLRMGAGSEDIEATVRCLTALGARIERMPDALRVTPIVRAPTACDADCGESGSTLRFLLPVAAALGVDARFHMHGRLPDRPIAPLDRELVRGGCAIKRPQRDVLRIRGRLASGRYVLPGNVSSQYISGMLLALSRTAGVSELRVEGRLESADYVKMTLAALERFGARPEQTEVGFVFRGRDALASPEEVQVGGDWSNAAFWLCADALDGCAVNLHGLDPASAQGDRRIVDELAALKACAGEIRTVDAADIPDMVPALAACACALGQRLRVVHAQRLRIKESDRLQAICRTLNGLGGAVSETDDGLFVDQVPRMTGGDVDAFGDHRIAMMAAIASIACAGEVVIRGAEAVNKSYPDFWRDFSSLGGQVSLETEANT